LLTQQLSHRHEQAKVTTRPKTATQQPKSATYPAPMSGVLGPGRGGKR